MDIASLIPSSNFDFELCERNADLLSKGYTMPRTKKTGTTICGCIFDGGVVLAADTRATSGSTVLDKNCEKLHFLSPNMYCAGAGTAADTEHVTKNISIQLDLLRLHTNRPSRVATAVTMLHDHLFKYGGQIGAYLIIAGLDVQGNHLVMISADGNFRHLPFATMGSGSLAAMSVMENKFKDSMTVKDI
jgi:20S proteasome subunit beta 2